MKLAIVVIAAVLLQQSGCDEQAPKTAAQPAHHYPPIHRFENVSSPVSPGVALDTVTGQYCKTWEWMYKASGMKGGLDLLPTCLSIYQDTPTFEK